MLSILLMTNDRVLVHVISAAWWRLWAAKRVASHEQRRHARWVERQARAWNRADPAAIVADFAPDGVLVSPRGRWRATTPSGAPRNQSSRP